MNSKQRVLKALHLEKPDRVPFVELMADTGFTAKLLNNHKAGTKETQNKFSDLPVLSVPTIGSHFDEIPEIANCLELDAVGVTFWIKHLGVGDEMNGRQIFSGSSISAIEDVKNIRFPDPHDKKLYEPLEQFLDTFTKTDKALYCVSNLGSDPVVLGLGFENFCMDIYTNRDMVIEMLRLYSDWQAEVFTNLSKLDFDFLWTTDDIAFKTSTYIAPDDIKELLMPGYEKVAANISKPWIYHSDGDLNAVLDDLITLGMNGIHPVEPGPMNLKELHDKYSQKVCFTGHIDINVLSEGTPAQVDLLVKKAISDTNNGQSYICGSSNSVTNYCKPENVIAMKNAILKYGK
jgi:uroporphyrinogen decarboxylase